MINVKIDEEEMNELKYLLFNEYLFLFDKDFVLKFNNEAREFILVNDFRLIKSCSPQLGNDKELVLELIKSYVYNFKYLNEQMRDDKDVVQTALNIRTNIIPYVSERLRDDDDIVNFVINENPKLIKYTSDRFKNNKSLILKLLKINNDLLPDIHEDLKSDIDILLEVWNNLKKESGDYILFKDKTALLLNSMSKNTKPFFELVDPDLSVFSVTQKMEEAFNQLKLHTQLTEELNISNHKKSRKIKI